jgi:hypothetical protein
MTERIVEILSKIYHEQKRLVIQNILIKASDNSDLYHIDLTETPCPIQPGMIFNFERLLIGK